MNSLKGHFVRVERNGPEEFSVKETHSLPDRSSKGLGERILDMCFYSRKESKKMKAIVVFENKGGTYDGEYYNQIWQRAVFHSC